MSLFDYAVHTTRQHGERVIGPQTEIEALRAKLRHANAEIASLKGPGHNELYGEKHRTLVCGGCGERGAAHVLAWVDPHDGSFVEWTDTTDDGEEPTMTYCSMCCSYNQGIECEGERYAEEAERERERRELAGRCSR